MINNRAREVYLYNLHGKGMTFDSMTETVKPRFITAEHEQTSVRELDSLKLSVVMSEHLCKQLKFYLEEIVSCMNALESGLLNSYCNDEIFTRKYVNI